MTFDTARSRPGTERRASVALTSASRCKRAALDGRPRPDAPPGAPGSMLVFGLTPMSKPVEVVVRKDQLSERKVIPMAAAEAELGPEQAELAVDLFALTANNITY